MLKYISVLFVLISVVYGRGESNLTFYPSSPQAPTYINSQFDRLNVYKNIMTIKAMPLGVIAESIDVLDPVFERLSYRYDFEKPNTFYDRISGKTVYFETDEGDRKETTFITKHGDDIFVRQGSQIVINPKGRLFAPANERYVLEPELDIEVSSRYKAYKKASITYYNKLITSFIQYEFKYYKDSNSIILLSNLIALNKSNKSYTGSVSYSSKAPLFSQGRVSSVSSFKEGHRNNQMELQTSEIYKETLKKTFTIPIGQSKLPIFQTSVTGLNESFTMSFHRDRESVVAERVLVVKNETERPWLPGMSHIFINDDLSEVEYIPYISIGEDLTLKLSSVNELKGKKVTTQEKTDIYRVTLILKNNSDKQQLVSVIDQLPYNARIDESISFFVNNKHQYQQEVTLESSEEKEIEYSYTRER
jgi:hypothetical protein